MDMERSKRMSRLTDAGISARNVGSSFLMLSTTSMVLVPGCRWMARMTALVFALDVVPARHFVVLHTVDDPADILEPDGIAVPVCHDQRTIGCRIHELAGRLYGE